MDAQISGLELDSGARGSSSPFQASRQRFVLPAAAGAALIGALAWAAIYWFTDSLVPWMACGIGAGVGVTCAALGGRREKQAILCAAIALAGIGLGRGLVIATRGSKLKRDFLYGENTQRNFADRIEDARLWCALGDEPSSEQAVRFAWERGYVVLVERGAWMVAHYSVRSLGGQLRESIDDFKAEEGPMLVADHRTPLTLDAFRERLEARWRGIPISNFIEVTTSSFDLLWGSLGVSLAFGIVHAQRKRRTSVSVEIGRRAGSTQFNR